MPARRPRSGFTLANLLAACAVVSLAVGLIVPAMNHSRLKADRTQCHAQLRQIGLGFEQYLDIHSGVLPEAAVLPSFTPDRPSIASVLAPHVADNALTAFRCPSDRQYFPVEGTSYEYPAGELAGHTLEEACRTQGSAQIWLLYDFECFHGPSGSPANRNALWSDFSVRPLR
jgi:Tfp pilus assembly protein PilE